MMLTECEINAEKYARKQKYKIIGLLSVIKKERLYIKLC